MRCTVLLVRFQVPPQNLQIPLIRALILYGERHLCEIRASLLQIQKNHERRLKTLPHEKNPE